MERLTLDELIAKLREHSPTDVLFAQSVAEACATQADRVDLTADRDVGAAIRGLFELD